MLITISKMKPVAFLVKIVIPFLFGEGLSIFRLFESLLVITVD